PHWAPTITVILLPFRDMYPETGLVKV
ncbi:uncharacterized protein METZ01_LOCUS448773, partial [marine metagenome]